MEHIGTLADLALLWPLWLGVAVALLIIWVTRHADPFRSGRVRHPVQTHADRVETNIRQEMELRTIAAQGQARQDFYDR